jgi:LysM repeat protein
MAGLPGGILLAMTVTGEPPRPLPAEVDASAPPSRRRDGLAVREVCPFLVADDGTWRSAYAAREHRCGAVRPPAPLADTKQRQLCLVAAHAGCATYIAARAVADEVAPPTPGDDGAALWRGSAPPPLVLEPARRMGLLPTASAKGGGQALVIGLMVVAFLVLVIARTQSPGSSTLPTPGPSLADVAVATSIPAASPRPSTIADASPAPQDSPAAVVEPTARTADPATPAPRRYTVKSGDTLSSIAARYGTTVRKLQVANEISNPRALKIGQVLAIP